MFAMHSEENCYEIHVYKSKLSHVKTLTFPSVQFYEKGYLC